MGEYKRLISYIYSYEKGIKGKNAGFAKIELKNDICKINVSLRIADELMNEAEDNMLDVYFFCRKGTGVKKIFLDKIKIVNGCSLLKLRMSAENINYSGIGFEELAGIFVCTKAFETKNSTLNIIYASEWDDIPINVFDFMNPESSDQIQSDIMKDSIEDVNEENNISDETIQIKSASFSELDYDNQHTIHNIGNYNRYRSLNINEDLSNNNEEPANQPDNNAINNEMENPSTRMNNPGSEMENPGTRMNDPGSEMENPGTRMNDPGSEMENPGTRMNDPVTEMDEAVTGMGKTYSNIEKYDYQADMTDEEVMDSEKEFIPKHPDTGDYFKMLCNCYPKVKVSEINGECIKIAPQDISYLPKSYWHLSNNSFLLHGYYNYKYLLFCKKKVGDKDRYMVGVPGIFHQKEQMIAKMFGFTEFESNMQDNILNKNCCGDQNYYGGNNGLMRNPRMDNNLNKNGNMKFGYWCMYI